MSNRSEISGHKPNAGQNTRTGKSAPSVGIGQQKVTTAVDPKITPISEVPKPAKSEADILEQTQYAEQGKVAPIDIRASAELVADAGILDEVQNKVQGLKELAKHMEMPVDPRERTKTVEELEEAVNHRSGMSYSELKAAYEVEKARAEEFGEILNQARIIVNNPFHRYGQFVDSEPIGRALKMEKVWQPKASR